MVKIEISTKRLATILKAAIRNKAKSYEVVGSENLMHIWGKKYMKKHVKPAPDHTRSYVTCKLALGRQKNLYAMVKRLPDQSITVAFWPTSIELSDFIIQF